MKVKNGLFGTLCMLILAATLTACSDNDKDMPWQDDGSAVELPQHRAYILNQGKYESNNSGIAFYAPHKDAKDSKHNFISNIYKIQNNKELGDTGQDIIEYEGNLFVTVYGSKLIVKLNSACVEEARLSFSEADGAPRYMAAHDGKIYVTLYSGKVAKIDAGTLKIEGYVDVQSNPEEIVENDGKLYVANSGYGSGTTVSIIDMQSFTKKKDLVVAVNPNNLLEVNDEIYLLSWGKTWGEDQVPIAFQRIKNDESYETIAEVSKFAKYKNTIYLVYTTWDQSASNRFFSYNTETHTLNENSFLKDVPEALQKETVYSISIDPSNGDFYLSVSNYSANGDIYRFKNDGTYLEKFDCGGINPAKVLFL